MNPETVFRLAGPDIVHDAIDGGIVIVNLAEGTYFTLDGVAREIWTLLESGRSLSAINVEIGRRFDGDPRLIADATDRFLARLQEEGLIVVAPGSAASEPPPDQEGGERQPFAPPSLVKFTDLEDLLTLDPIHEVDDSGWPHVRPPGDSR